MVLRVRGAEKRFSQVIRTATPVKPPFLSCAGVTSGFCYALRATRRVAKTGKDVKKAPSKNTQYRIFEGVSSLQLRPMTSK